MQRVEINSFGLHANSQPGQSIEDLIAARLSEGEGLLRRDEPIQLTKTRGVRVTFALDQIPLRHEATEPGRGPIQEHW
jgi:hypothetical protein